MVWLTLWRIVNIIALLAAIPPIWPYGYFILLRVTTCALSGTLSFFSFKLGKTPWGILFGIMAFVFNPIFPLHLGKEIWTIVDLSTAVIFGISFLLIKPRNIS